MKCPECEILEDIELDEREFLRVKYVKCSRCKQNFQLPIFKKKRSKK